MFNYPPVAPGAGRRNALRLHLAADQRGFWGIREDSGGDAERPIGRLGAALTDRRTHTPTHTRTRTHTCVHTNLNAYTHIFLYAHVYRQTHTANMYDTEQTWNMKSNLTPFCMPRHTHSHTLAPLGQNPTSGLFKCSCPSGVKVSSTPEVPPQLEACYTGSITRQTNHLTLT